MPGRVPSGSFWGKIRKDSTPADGCLGQFLESP